MTMVLTSLVQICCANISGFNTDLYWYDLYAPFYPYDGFIHLGATWEYTFSYEDCPLITEWFELDGNVNGNDANAPGLVECKELCMERNVEWSGGPMSTPPCTSISIDPLSNECVLRQCDIFPMIPPEFSISHIDMTQVDPRYGGNRDRWEGTFIRDYFLNVFDTDPTTGDSHCLRGETFHRIPPGEYDFHQTEGSFVCKYNGSMEEYPFDVSNMPIPIPIKYFFEPEPPVFDNCWQDAYDVASDDSDDQYLTYWFAINMKKDFKDHFFEFEEQFNKHGYFTVEDSVNIVWEKARWIFQKQFNVDIRISRVMVQNNDGSYPEVAWRPGDAGLVNISEEWAGGTGLEQTCTPKSMEVGHYIFEHDRPGYFNPSLVTTIAHEMMHFLGQPHSPIPNPDLQAVDGLLSHRRCNKIEDASQQRRCNYHAFIPLHNIDDQFKYTERFCKHIRTDQAKSCAMVMHLNDESPTYPPGQSDVCPLDNTGGPLCPNGDTPCKYVTGGTNWGGGDGARCPDYESEGYAPVFRERDFDDQSVYSAYSEYACKRALQDMIDNFDVDIQIGSKVRIAPGEEDGKDPIFSIYSYDRPVGCFIECVEGNLYGFFNHNAGNYVENPGNSEAHPLCIRESTIDQCYDSEEKFVYKIKPNGKKKRRYCKFIAKKSTKKRCKKKEKENEEKVSNLCPKTCSACDDGDFFWLRK